MSDWERHLENIRETQDRQALENQSLGKNSGATRPSDFASPVLWGMVGAILGGILGRGLIGALVGIAVLGGGLYLVKRAFPASDQNVADSPRLRWALVGGAGGLLIAAVTRAR